MILKTKIRMKTKNKRLLQYCSLCFAVLLLTTSIAAQNIAPYTDKYGRFKVFDNGVIHDLEHKEVSEVSTGRDFVVYRNNIGHVKEYAEGEVTYVSNSRRLEFFAVMDSRGNISVSEGYEGFFTVSDRETSIVLETSRPKRVEVFDNVVAYMDIDGRLKAYYEGKKVNISNQIVRDFQLIGRVIVYTLRNGRVKIFHDGKHYSG